jgi:hypothetical protein
MQMRRAVLLKADHPKHFCEVGCPEPRSTEPYGYVIWIDELYVRTSVADHHDTQGRICAYVYHPHYEI